MSETYYGKSVITDLICDLISLILNVNCDINIKLLAIK